MSKIPAWGCPWHGLIKDDKLTLSNGEQINMRQPQGGDGWPRGSTNLIDLGVEPVASQPDAETGKQWLNKAILSSDQIHGVLVGDGSWIYQAPDSSLWRVSTSLPATNGDAESILVTLDRFGEFCTKKETYSYTVPTPDITAIKNIYIDTVFREPALIMVRRFSVHPKGHAATFNISAQFLYSNGNLPGFYLYEKSRGTIGWIEITLSGPANDCEISADTIYANKTSPLISSDVFSSTPQDWVVSHSDTETDTTVEQSPVCTGTYEYQSTPYLTVQSTGSYSRDFLVDGAVMSVFYKPDGTRSTINMTVSVETTESTEVSITESIDLMFSYDVEKSPGTEACRRVVTKRQAGMYETTQISTLISNGTIAFSVDGVTAATDSMTARRVLTRITRKSQNDLPRGYGGVDPHINSSVETRKVTWEDSYGNELNAFEGNLSHELAADWTSTFYRSLFMIGGEGDSSSVFYKKADILSNNSISLTRASSATGQPMFRYPSKRTALPYLITPDGKKTVDLITFTLQSQLEEPPIMYASYNPITHEVVRTTDEPVCWT